MNSNGYWVAPNPHWAKCGHMGTLCMRRYWFFQRSKLKIFGVRRPAGCLGKCVRPVSICKKLSSVGQFEFLAVEIVNYILLFTFSLDMYPGDFFTSLLINRKTHTRALSSCSFCTSAQIYLELMFETLWKTTQLERLAWSSFKNFKTLIVELDAHTHMQSQPLVSCWSDSIIQKRTQ
jgi:hypothetical protein